MRLWSIHPCYLDCKGLVALWREGLLAQKVIVGQTKGYKNHSQLCRFYQQNNPLHYINAFLHYVCDYADCIGYKFNRSKILGDRQPLEIPVTSGQIIYETSHLLKKLRERHSIVNPDILNNTVILNPLFKLVDGPIEPWEIVKN